MSRYIITRDNDGQIVKLHHRRELISLDELSQPLCDFLSWLSVNQEREAPGRFQTKQCKSLLHGAYFCDAASLIRHCAAHGIHLKADLWEILGPGMARLEHKTSFEVADFSFERLELAGTYRFDKSVYATSEAIGLVQQQLNDSQSHARRVTTVPLDRSFVYLDVSDFSEQAAIHQVQIIGALIQIVKDAEAWSGHKLRLPPPETMFCIGDGYIFAFESPTVATCFAAVLADLIEGFIANTQIIEFHFRMGVHVGQVFSFWDPGRNDWNYVGDGINEGSRVLSAIGKEVDDVVFISSEVRTRLRSDSEFTSIGLLECLQNRGRRKDKHEKMRRVYELDHTRMASCLREAEPVYERRGPWASDDYAEAVLVGK